MNQKWDQLWKEPFKGLTTDGSVIPDLYPVQDDNILIASIVQAANSVVMALSEVEKDRCLRPLDAPERRAWSNPELYVHRFGVRLDEVNQEVFSAVRQLMKSTLSAEGYEKACTAMRINGFLGRLVNGSKVLNENSYNILLFGQPSTVDPWGWSIYGHHLCLNVFLHKRQIIISPTFTGAEPTTIDSGPFQGSRLFEPEEQLGLRFMQRLPSQLQVKAQIYKEMHDPAMPAWRFNPADQRHICGAFQDNRIVPYEGVCLTELDPSFTDLLLQIVRQFLLYLPQQAYENRRRQILKHSSETYFSWIGGFTDTDPFYYRIQSPVIVCEFDHHSGVFLSNSKPAKFHTHTIVRSPNAGDYGYTLINS